MNRKRLEAYKRRLVGANIYMREWQTRDGYPVNTAAKTSAALHKCGNAACAAGYLAVLPEFKRAGGSATDNGMPMFLGGEGAEALAEFFGISEALAEAICLPHGYYSRRNSLMKLVGKPWENWNADDLIKIVDAILAGEYE
jgi:hypothetical protein